MFKLLTGSLMLALSAFSFSVIANSDVPPPYVDPKIENIPSFEVMNPVTSFGFFPTQALAFESILASYKATNTYTSKNDASEPSCFYNYIGGQSMPEHVNGHLVDCKFTYGNAGSGAVNTKSFRTIRRSPDHLSKECPPELHPDYKIGPRPSPDNPEHEVCFPKFPLCPKGYFKFSVEPYGCVPIKCPGKGESVNDITTHGNLPFGESGTFCDGSCSYSVGESATEYDGANYASGVSNGAVCGSGGGEFQSNFTPEDEEGDCTTHELSNGLKYQECTNVTEPDEGEGENNGGGTDTGIDNEENKVDETATDSDFEGMDCGTVNDKEACYNKNITDAINDQTKKQKKADAVKHNKLVEQQKEITDYVEKKNEFREKRRSEDATQMINGLNGIQQAIVTGGTGAGGGGSTDEGLVSAIDGIGESLGESDVETDSEPSAGIESFYEAEYPNGFQDVWNNNQAAFDASAPAAYVKQWEVSVSGTAPDLNMCFDLGAAGNYGCKTFEIDPRVFPFLRIIILLSTAFLCRALVMGG